MSIDPVLSFQGNRNRVRRHRKATKIILKDYCVEMFLGLHDFEKEKPQRVLLSVSIELEDPDAFWDYDLLVAFLEGEISGSQIETQEELCERLIAFVENGPSLRSVVVQTKKPDIFRSAGFVSLEQRVEYEEPL